MGARGLALGLERAESVSLPHAGGQPRFAHVLLEKHIIQIEYTRHKPGSVYFVRFLNTFGSLVSLLFKMMV